jgi:hypothetical protein
MGLAREDHVSTSFRTSIVCSVLLTAVLFAMAAQSGRAAVPRALRQGVNEFEESWHAEEARWRAGRARKMGEMRRIEAERAEQHAREMAAQLHSSAAAE